MTRLEAIRKRIAEATPGPWQRYEDGKRANLLPNYAIESCSMQSLGGDPAQICENLKGKNANLIAHAPSDIALLLNALDRAMGALREARSTLRIFSTEVGDIVRDIEQMLTTEGEG